MLNRMIAPPIKDAKEFNLQLPLYKKQVLSNGVEVFAIDLGTEDALMITWVFNSLVQKRIDGVDHGSTSLTHSKLR